MKMPILAIMLIAMLPVLHASGESVESSAVPASKMNFNGVRLSRALEMLRDISVDADPFGVGINIVLLDPENKDPKVKLTLRHTDLAKALDHVTASVGYQWDIEDGAVVLRPGVKVAREPVGMETHFYSLSRSSVIRMIGYDPNRTREEEEVLLKAFFRKAGVAFE